MTENLTHKTANETSNDGAGLESKVPQSGVPSGRSLRDGLSAAPSPVRLWWANPIEHAMVLIDACGGLDAALDAASFNCENASTDFDSLYWFNVAQALVPPEACA